MQGTPQNNKKSEIIESVECSLKWFNTSKGFGFVVSNAINSDIFIHASTLQRNNHPLIGDGAELTCNVEKSQNGYFVKNIVHIHNCGDTPFIQKEEKDSAEGLTLATTGVVKRYMPCKEYGFIVPEDGVKDIFVHKSCLVECDIEELLPGQTVKVFYKTVAKGREATKISIISNP
ncbi:MAG: hypothetical protein CMH28_07835 [Micavibrio sp.]|nr:hypothetical protein [Micavibrio sp.]